MIDIKYLKYKAHKMVTSNCKSESDNQFNFFGLKYFDLFNKYLDTS